MSNETNSDKTAPNFALAPPPEATTLSSRAEGFWDEDKGVPVYGTLLFAREITPKTGPSAGKLKRYYLVELLADTWLAENKERKQPERIGHKGEVIAVWGTTGNTDLNRAQGAKVWIKKNPPDKFIDTGKGNPMKTYDMRIVGKGSPVQVIKFNEDPAEPARDAVPSDDKIPF